MVDAEVILNENKFLDIYHNKIVMTKSKCEDQVVM